jgi:multicomponent Na+:H+ antiporter subunit E
MRMLVGNLLVALFWAMLSGDFSGPSVAVGFVAGYVLLWALQPALGRSVYFAKLGQILGLGAFLAWELVAANVKVAWSVLMPTRRLRPAVVAVPLDARTDLEIALLSNLITLTPGSFGVDVSEDRRFLYVHTIDFEDVETFRRQIKDGFERRLLEVLR